VLPLFEAEAPTDGRPRDAIDRARAFARGDLDAAGSCSRVIRNAYAAKAAALGVSDDPMAVFEEIGWQLENIDFHTRAALQQLPLLGENSAGPLGPGPLASGILGSTIRHIQSAIEKSAPSRGGR
jgi:hypothetical protein